MTGASEILAIAEDRADWLLDAVAAATQNRMFLRGDSECDEVICDAILMNGAKAISAAIARYAATPKVQLDAATRVGELAKELLELAPSAGVYVEVKISPKMNRARPTASAVRQDAPEPSTQTHTTKKKGE